MSKITHNIHDHTAKLALSNVNRGRALLEAYLPKDIQTHFNLASLEVCNTTFIDKYLKAHLTDILYKAEIQGRTGYVYLLIEAQSTVDRLMPFRVLQYMVKVMDYHLKEQEAAGEPPSLPFIYPLVYYTGKSTYTASCDLFDLFAKEEQILAREHFLKPFKLIDLNRISDEELKTHRDVRTLELIQKHIHDRDMTLFLKALIEEGFLLEISGDIDYFEVMLKYLLSAGEIRAPDDFINSAIQQLPEMEDKVMTMADYFRHKGQAQIIEQLAHEAHLGQEARVRIQSLSEEAKVSTVIDVVREESKEEGKEETKIEMARKMKADGMAIEKISEFTELSQAVIEGL
jgi:predicted transposase/invertase (TIGR01784 family)